MHGETAVSTGGESQRQATELTPPVPPRAPALPQRAGRGGRWAGFWRACGAFSARGVAGRHGRFLRCPCVALRAFVADRNERRNITAGQKAMGRAMLFP